MITVVLTRSLEHATKQIATTNDRVDCYEIRLDTFKELTYELVASIVELIDKPFILTLRKENQGGWFSNDSNKQIETLQSFLALKPDYIDLEFNTPFELVSSIKKLHPQVKIIASYHEFHSASKNLEKLFNLTFKWDADIYKMVLKPSSSLDVIDMLEFTRKKNLQGMPFVGICLDEIGQLTRILAPIFQSPFCYASSDDEDSVAPGQVSAAVLFETYRYKELNPQTKVYALLGNPISQSPSHITHNLVMKELGLNAVYVKIKLEVNEFKPFLDKSLKLGFAGFSITVPFKELAFEHCFAHDRLSKNIKSVNTLKQEGGVWKTTNTDAPGALDAIEKFCEVKGKTCVVLGAGGTARAVVYESIYRGAKSVKIVNKTYDRAVKLAKEFGCDPFDLKKLETAFNDPYHILINTTTVGMTNPNTSPISKMYLDPGAIVLDVILKPKDTKLIADAQEKGCKAITGLDMFIRQAAYQFAFWFDLNGENSKITHALEKALKI